jgi:SAM-dependent methyltransferase
MHDAESKAALVVPSYATGDYYASLPMPDQDDTFKVNEFLSLFSRVAGKGGLRVESYIDVGCGSGGVAAGISAGLRAAGQPLQVTKGYDVSPHVAGLQRPGIEWVHGDFCQSQEKADLVTLFDVMEHVPDPVQFMRGVAQRCQVLALHIPLDDSLGNALLDRYRVRLRYPGHLIFLNPATALTMLASAGLVVLDYKYTHGYMAPSGRASLLQKIAIPFRWMLGRISPWLASRCLGGLSLMVIAATPTGMRTIKMQNAMGLE